jgi:hypothetical protein
MRVVRPVLCAVRVVSGTIRRPSARSSWCGRRCLSVGVPGAHPQAGAQAALPARHTAGSDNCDDEVGDGREVVVFDVHVSPLLVAIYNHHAGERDCGCCIGG